jgi:hypothetical protein
MVTAIRGTQTAPPIFRVLPRALIDPLLNAATRVDMEKRSSARTLDPSTRGRALRLLLWPVRRANKRNERNQRSAAANDDVPLKALVPTMHYDAQLVVESEGSLASFRGVRAEVLLLGGSKSPAYLKKSLLGLERVLPNVRRVTLPGVAHLAADNSGKPEMVAAELRRFFSEYDTRGAEMQEGPNLWGPGLLLFLLLLTS